MTSVSELHKQWSTDPKYRKATKNSKKKSLRLERRSKPANPEQIPGWKSRSLDD